MSFGKPYRTCLNGFSYAGYALAAVAVVAVVVVVVHGCAWFGPSGRSTGSQPLAIRSRAV